MNPVKRPAAAEREKEIKKLLGKPVKVSKKKLRKFDLDKVEDEMWLP